MRLKPEQIVCADRFEKLRESILHLIALHADILLDDSCENDPEFLVENLAGSLPLVWVLTDEDDRVRGLVSATDVIPGRHAFIHGVSDPCIRRCPEITNVSLQAMGWLFGSFDLLKIKAEFETDNAGARGFCLRLGFRREAIFREDNSIGGYLHDVAVYSLTREKFDALERGWRRDRAAS